MVRSSLILLLLIPRLSLATPREVPSEYPDIAQAMSAADSNDTIRIDAQAYTGEANQLGHLVVGKSLRFEGVNGSPTIPGMLVYADLDIQLADLTLDGPVIDVNRDAALYHQTGGTLDAERVTLAATSDARGLYLTAVQAQVIELAAGGFVGKRAVELREGTTATIKDGAFIGNQFGAVLASVGSTVTIDGGSFSDNSAGRGADVEVLGQSALIVQGGTTFSGSQSGNGGGSLYIARSGADISDATFTNISADGPGGALFATMTVEGEDAADSLYPLTLRNTTFTHVIGVAQGGALLLNNSDAIVENVVFTGCTVLDLNLDDENPSEGGCIAAGSGKLQVLGSQFSQFKASGGDGGAIAIIGSSFNPARGILNASDTTFSGRPEISEAGRGGALSLGAANATLTRVFVQDVSTDLLAGGIHVIDSSVLATDVDMDSVGSTGVGGAYRAVRSDLTISGGVLTNLSAPNGAAVAFVEGSTSRLDVNNAWFQGLTVAISGSAVLVDEIQSLAVRQNRFCELGATALGGYPADGSVLQILGHINGTADFENNIAVSMSEGAAAVVRRGHTGSTTHASGLLNMRHNTLLDVVPVEIWHGTADLENNIFGQAPIGLELGPLASDVTGDYNLWWALDQDATLNDALPGLHAVYGDPEIIGYPDAGCGIKGWLSEASIARGAGRPSPDGSATDIGATGGTFSILDDLDGDGVPEDLDCDDNDPTSYPGAEEDWSDSVDHDCSGDGLIDQDGDSFPASEDCDDTNADIHPLATDIPQDGIDQDCSGQDVVSVVGGSCDSAPMLPSLWLAPLALLVRRRR